MKSKKINNTLLYVILTYIVFWCSIGLVGAAFFASGQNKAVFNWASSVCSWTPTIIFLILFKRLVPGESRKEWFKKAFAPRVRISLLAAAAFALIFSFYAATLFTSFRSGQPFLSMLNFSLPVIASGMFFALIQGATGEEAGWRGYLQQVMEKKAGGVIKGSVLVGLIWSFWHTPLWFVQGLPAMDLIVYILTFIAGNICLSIIIGVCFDRNKNLAVPMWIHFVSNASFLPYAGSLIEPRYWLVLFYALAAAGFALWRRYDSKKSKSLAAEAA